MKTLFVALIVEWSKIPREERLDMMDGTAAPGLVERIVKERLYATYSLDAESVEDVFRILNIEHPADYANRSLSVGDMVLEPSTGIVTRCAPMGWERIPEALEAQVNLDWNEARV